MGTAFWATSGPLITATSAAATITPAIDLTLLISSSPSLFASMAISILPVHVPLRVANADRALGSGETGTY